MPAESADTPANIPNNVVEEIIAKVNGDISTRGEDRAADASSWKPKLSKQAATNPPRPTTRSRSA